MSTHRKAAIAVGVLFLVATAAYIVGSGLITAALGAPDHLARLDGEQVRIGVLLELLDAAAVVAIGVLLFPTFRRYSEGAALGYAGARIIESGLILVSLLGALLLPTVSREYLRAGAGDAAHLQTLETMARAWYDLAFQLAMVTLGVGSLLLCYLLYTFRLVPRVLAVLGAVGYGALFASGWSALLGGDLGLVLYAPGAIFEVVFPLWLIIKGFNEPAPPEAESGGLSRTRRGVTVTSTVGNH